MESKKSNTRLSTALSDPASLYSQPRDVLADRKMTTPQKIEILRRWEYDEAEKQVAEEEGMTGNEDTVLRKILLALDALTGGVDVSRTPPTKQGGLATPPVKKVRAQKKSR